MKKIVFLALVTFLNSLLCLGQIKINGLDYTVSTYNGTAILESAPTSLSGSFTIPSTISYKGRNYRVINIQHSAFMDCSQLTSIVIPSSVIVINSYAFQNCTGLTSIKLPERLEMLGVGVFQNCYNLVSVELPYIHNNYGGYQELSDELFNGCSSLVYVKIPPSIDGIGSYTFKDCINLTDVFCYPTKVPGLANHGGNAFDGTKRGEIRIHVPKESLDKYKNSNWNVFKCIDSNMKRPQLQKKVTQNNTNSREAIDMGGSIEWANMNIEATSPTDPGGVFAWGETSSKNEFSSRNYSEPKLGRYKYDDGLKDTNYDVAKVKWGNEWRMPTEKEFNELIWDCKQILHIRDKYVEFIAPNGNKLVFPVLPNANITYNGIGNFYWTSSLNHYGSVSFDFSNSGYVIETQGLVHTYLDQERISHFTSNNKNGYYGGLVRPVRDKRSSYKQQMTYTYPQTNTSQKVIDSPQKKVNKPYFTDDVTDDNIFKALESVHAMCDDAEASEKDKAISLYKDAYELYKKLELFPTIYNHIHPGSFRIYKNRIIKGLKERGSTIEESTEQSSIQSVGDIITVMNDAADLCEKARASNNQKEIVNLYHTAYDMYKKLETDPETPKYFPKMDLITEARSYVEQELKKRGVKL